MSTRPHTFLELSGTYLQHNSQGPTEGRAGMLMKADTNDLVAASTGLFLPWLYCQLLPELCGNSVPAIACTETQKAANMCPCQHHMCDNNRAYDRH